MGYNRRLLKTNNKYKSNSSGIKGLVFFFFFFFFFWFAFESSLQQIREKSEKRSSPNFQINNPKTK